MKPYGYVRKDGEGLFIYGEHQFQNAMGAELVPVYLHPKEWVGLTDDELIECERLADIRHRKHMGSVRGQQLSPADQFLWHYARATEAKLKEKNHG